MTNRCTKAISQPFPPSCQWPNIPQFNLEIQTYPSSCQCPTTSQLRHANDQQLDKGKVSIIATIMPMATTPNSVLNFKHRLLCINGQPLANAISQSLPIHAIGQPVHNAVLEFKYELLHARCQPLHNVILTLKNMICHAIAQPFIKPISQPFRPSCHWPIIP